MTMVQDVVAGSVGAVALHGRAAAPAPLVVPCAARPGSGLAHLDGPCQCFFGGPAPEFLGDGLRGPSPLPSRPSTR
jgi:hypothetical protein